MHILRFAPSIKKCFYFLINRAVFENALVEKGLYWEIALFTNSSFVKILICNKETYILEQFLEAVHFL